MKSDTREFRCHASGQRRFFAVLLAPSQAASDVPFRVPLVSDRTLQKTCNEPRTIDSQARGLSGRDRRKFFLHVSLSRFPPLARLIFHARVFYLPARRPPSSARSFFFSVFSLPATFFFPPSIRLARRLFFPFVTLSLPRRVAPRRVALAKNKRQPPCPVSFLSTRGVFYSVVKAVPGHVFFYPAPPPGFFLCPFTGCVRTLLNDRIT